MTRPTNTELIRAGIEAFNRGDSEAILETLTEDVEWKRVDGLPDGGGVLHGREAVREFLKPDVFAAERFEALEMVEGEDVIMVRGVFRATGAASGIVLDVEACTVYKLNDEGLAWRVENWNDRADAERSAGLRFAGRRGA